MIHKGYIKVTNFIKSFYLNKFNRHIFFNFWKKSVKKPTLTVWYGFINTYRPRFWQEWGVLLIIYEMTRGTNSAIRFLISGYKIGYTGRQLEKTLRVVFDIDNDHLTITSRRLTDKFSYRSIWLSQHMRCFEIMRNWFFCAGELKILDPLALLKATYFAQILKLKLCLIFFFCVSWFFQFIQYKFYTLVEKMRS